MAGQQGHLISKVLSGTESGSLGRTLLLEGAGLTGDRWVCQESRVRTRMLHGCSWKIRVPFSAVWRVGQMESGRRLRMR